MLKAGTESIMLQKDTRFLKSLERDIEETNDIINISLPDIVASNENDSKSFKEYDAYKRSLKAKLFDKVTKSMSKTLGSRFGITFELKNTYSTGDLVKINIPPLNSKVLSSAMSDLDSLFPKKQTSSILWNVVANKNEQMLYSNLKDIKEAIQTNKFQLDLKHAKIKGLDHTTISIKVNFLRAAMLRLNPGEVASLILQKIGVLFTHLEYMYTTTNNNFVLLDTFLTERFTKQTPALDAIKIAIDKTDADVKVDTSSPVAFLNTLDIYMLRTYRFDASKKSIKIDYETLSDQFVSLFGYGSDLANAIIKAKTSATVAPDGNTNLGITTLVFLLKTYIYLSMFIMSLLFFSVFGLVAILIAAGLVAFKMVISFILDIIASILNAFFSTDVETDVTSNEMVTRLNRIKLDVIKQLRTEADGSKADQAILVSQIDEIKHSIDFVKEKTGLLYEYGEKTANYKNEDTMQLQNEFIEQLSENELHFFKAKFKNT